MCIDCFMNSSTFLEVLKTIHHDTPFNTYAPMLQALVLWKQSSPLLNLVTGWLEAAAKTLPLLLNGTKGMEEGESRSETSDALTRSKKRKKDADRQAPDKEDDCMLSQPLVALEFMKYLMVLVPHTLYCTVSGILQ